MSGFNMDDYITVPERVALFNAAYPEGSLQSEIVELTLDRVTVKAFAYRKPDDPRPGVGHSSLEIPGKTSFTKGSEIENAETSAWGRAIAALGFEVKRGIASREEVRNKQPEQAKPVGRRSGPAPAQNQYRRAELAEAMKEHGMDLAAVELLASAIGIPSGQRATNEQMDALIAAVRGETVERIDAPGVGGATESPVSVETGASDAPKSGAPPPQPGTPEYAALPTPLEKAAARAYWANPPEPEQATLAEALGNPVTA